MITTVYLDMDKNYLVDTVTGEKVDKYDPDKNLCLVMDKPNSIISVNKDGIKLGYGGQITVQYNDNRYIINDGYQSSLVKTGYIIYKNYDEIRCIDSNEGVSIRSKVIGDIKDCLITLYKKYNRENPNCEIENILVDKFNRSMSIKGIDKDYSFIVNIDSIVNIVNKNKRRKDNSLPFYPFNKDMDKFGTMYISIFAKRETNINRVDDKLIYHKKYEVANKFIKDFIDIMGVDYHFSSLKINQKILYWKDI